MEPTRLRRLMAMLGLLPASPHRNMDAIANDLGVDPRTVRRDAALLARAGIIRHLPGHVWLDCHQRVLLAQLLEANPTQELQHQSTPECAAATS